MSRDAARGDPADRRAIPVSRSATLPALRLAQERYGWLSPEAFREVAEALEETPAYCMAVASFYDMYHLQPVGKHLVEVCTNVSCALVGAQQVLEAFQTELGVHAGETSEDGEVTLRTIECAGGCGWGTVVAVNHRYRERLTAADVPAIVEELQRGELSSSSSSPGAEQRPLDEARRLPRRRRLRGAREGAADGAGDGRRRRSSTPACAAAAAPSSRPAARRASSPRAPASRPTSSSTPTSRSRARSRTARSCSRVPFRLIEGCLITAHAIESDARLHLHPRRVPARVRGAARRARGGARARSCSAASRSCSTAAPAPTSAARRPRCSSRSRASAASRGTKPPFPAVAGLYASPSLINNVETIATVPKIIELGGAEYAKIGVPPDSSGTRVFSLSGNVVNGGNYELPMGIDAARADLRLRRRDPGRARAEGRDPRRLLGAGPDAPTSSTRRSTPTRWPRPARCSAPARSSSSTTAAAWCSSASAWRSSTCTRAVASARRAARGRAGWCRSSQLDRGGDGGAGRPRPAARRLRADPRQVPLSARRRSRDAGGELHQQVPRRVPGAPRQRLPDARQLVARARARAGRPAHARPVAEVPA